MKMGTKGLIWGLLLITYNSACSHPLVVAIGTLMLILYKHFPLVFDFVVCSSPVIAFAFLFLGIILNSSRPNERGVDDRSFSMNTISDGGCKVSVIENAKKDIAGKAGLDVNSVGNGEFSGDGKMDKVMPTVDELHPLLNIDAHLESPNSDTDTSLGSSKEDVEDSEVEKDEGERKDDALEVVVKWTADDEKNLRDVGTSELERNQRLEHLIAKRRARIFQRAETEKNFNFSRVENEKNLINLNFLRAEKNLNLIDLDSSNDPPSVVEELSRLLVVIPRRNPFDEPGDSPDDVLIQVPGSAPSVLLPRHTNPFDLPFDHNVNAGEGVPVDEQNQHHLLAAQSREMLFQPYFVPERMDSETSRLVQSQFSDSKVSSALELESVCSSVSNHETHSSREDETNNSEFISTSEANEEEERNNIGVIPIRSHLKSLSETNVSSPRTYMIKKELVEERYDDSSSSAYSEESQEEDSSSSSCSSLISALARTEIARKPDEVEGEVLGEGQVVEPVYDSSPSALENSISNLASIEHALLYLDKGNVKSTSSDMKAAEFTEITESVVVEANVGNDMTQKSVMDGEETSRSNANGNKVRPVLPLNMLVIGNDHTPREDLIPPPSPPSNFGVVENRLSILPSIPEEMLDELKHEENNNSEPTQQTEMRCICSTNENSRALENNPIALSTESQTSNEMTRTVENASNGLGDKSLANNPSSKATELIKTLIKKNSRKFGISMSTSSSSSSSDSD